MTKQEMLKIAEEILGVKLVYIQDVTLDLVEDSSQYNEDMTVSVESLGDLESGYYYITSQNGELQMYAIEI